MPTTAGRWTVVTAAGAAATGLLTGYPQLLVLAAACLAALVAAAVLTPGLRVQLGATWESSPVVEGTLAVLVVELGNTSRRGAAGVRVTVRPGTPGDPALTSFTVRWLGRGARQEVRRELLLARDVHVARLIEVEVTDPLGLVRRRAAGTVEAVLVVHPRVSAPGPDDLRPAEDDAGRTSARGRRQGASAFHAVRPYQPGDDLRHVHWFATARSDRLMVQDMVVPAPSRQVLVLDTSRTAYRDDEAFDTAVRICASIAVAAVRTQELVLVTGGGHTSRHRSRGARTAMLDALAGVRRLDGDPIAVPRVGGGAAVTLVTGTDADRRSWPPALRRGEVTVVRVGEPAGRSRRAGPAGRDLAAASLEDFARVWGPAWSD